ncbi:hypothetical protein VNI00_017247 [Paramarasmius palmivorus]|uniref:GST N-terminal domain-containing protein n=1 Tax=Paramarasmius palmivorus TaxID=297713 RepID=A0AAW0B8H4_9AGAR
MILKKSGLPLRVTKPDGSPHYTVPFIQDSSNGVVVSDSLRIAKYLDTTFPDTSQVAPADTGSQFLTSQEIMMRLYPMYPLARPSIHKSHSEAGKAVQERMYGLVMELQPEEKVALLEKGKQGFMEVIDRAKGDVYLTGEHPVFIDFVLAAGGLIYRATFGIDSAEWKEVASWKDGRWQRVVENMERYIQVA